MEGLKYAAHSLPFSELTNQLDKVHHNELRASIATSLGSDLARNSQKTAEQGLNQLVQEFSGDRQFVDIVHGFVGTLSQVQPSKLQEMLSDGSIPEGNRDYAYRILAQNLSRNSKQSVLEWLVEDESDYSNAAFGNTYRSWLRSESTPAESWVRALDAGNKRDRTVAVTIEHYLPKRDAEFVNAIEWLDEISDGALYQEKALRIAWNLDKIDPAAATDFAKNSTTRECATSCARYAGGT